VDYSFSFAKLLFITGICPHFRLADSFAPTRALILSAAPLSMLHEALFRGHTYLETKGGEKDTRKKEIPEKRSSIVLWKHSIQGFHVRVLESVLYFVNVCFTHGQILQHCRVFVYAIHYPVLTMAFRIRVVDRASVSNIVFNHPEGAIHSAFRGILGYFENLSDPGKSQSQTRTQQEDDSLFLGQQPQHQVVTFRTQIHEKLAVKEMLLGVILQIPDFVGIRRKTAIGQVGGILFGLSESFLVQRASGFQTQIRGDPVHPCKDIGFSPELMYLLMDYQERILNYVFGDAGIPGHPASQVQKTLPVLFHYLFGF
jgi:hypothetical protein